MVTLQEETKDLTWNGRRWTLRYSLMAEESVDLTHYGVSIRNETSGEQAMVSDVSLCQSVGENLLKVLAEGGVTPVTLRDVVEDFLAEI